MAEEPLYLSQLPRAEPEPLTSQEQKILNEIKDREEWQRNLVPFMVAATKHYFAWVAGFAVSALGFFTQMARTGEWAWLWWLCFALGVLVSSFQTWNDQERIIRHLIKRLVSVETELNDRTKPQRTLDSLAAPMAKGSELRQRCGMFGRATFDVKATQAEAEQWAKEVRAVLAAEVGAMAVYDFDHGNFTFVGAATEGLPTYLFVNQHVAGLSKVIEDLRKKTVAGGG